MSKDDHSFVMILVIALISLSGMFLKVYSLGRIQEMSKNVVLSQERL